MDAQISASDGGTQDGGINADAGGVEANRPFHMGMTSWPYEATIEAVQRTQDLVRQHGDLYAIWLDNGLPWAAAAGNGPYPQVVLDKLSELGAEFPEDRQRFVSVGLLDLTRSNLATDWEAAPRTGPFESIAFDDPRVLQAYGNWLDLVIEKLEPDWLNFAIEVSDVAHLAPQSWDSASLLLCSIYTGLKARHPNLPVFYSVALKHPGSEETQTLRSALTATADCTDYAAASSYGYMFYGHANAGDPDNLPDNWLRQIQDLVPNKPVIVAETAWPAEELNIDEWSISTASSAEFQRRYVQRLLTEAKALDAVLVTWWCAVDFDALWATVLNSDPLAAIWRDTGFYDQDLNARPSLDVWQTWLELPHRPGRQ